MLTADLVFLAAIVFVIGCNFYFGPRIRDSRIAMQWGTDGKPTWFAPKLIALWGMVAFMLLVRGLIWAAMTYTPRLVHGAELGIVGFSLTVAAAHLYVLMQARRA